MFERKLLCSLCSISEAGLLNLYSFLSLLLIRYLFGFILMLWCMMMFMRLFLIFTDNENNIYMHFSFWFISTLWNWDLRCGQYAVCSLVYSISTSTHFTLSLMKESAFDSIHAKPKSTLINKLKWSAREQKEEEKKLQNSIEICWENYRTTLNWCNDAFLPHFFIRFFFTSHFCWTFSVWFMCVTCSQCCATLSECICLFY